MACLLFSRRDAQRFIGVAAQVWPVGPQPAFGTYTKTIKELGFPIVVAIMLLYMIVADVPANVAATRRDVLAVRDALAAHVEQSELYVTRLSADMQRTNAQLARIMQQICVNTAQNTQDRSGCFP